MKVSELRTKTEEGAVTWCGVSFTSGHETRAPLHSSTQNPCRESDAGGPKAAPDFMALTVQQWDRP